MKKKSISNFYKKAQDVNLIFVIVMMLVIAITIVAGYKAVKELNSAVQNMDIATSEVKNMSQKVQDKYVVIWDVLFLVFFLFMYIVMIASAFFIDTHPVFFIITLLIVLVSAFVGGHIANSYAAFASIEQISTEANSFIIIPYIFQHYITIIVVMGMTTLIVLFAKIRSSSG